MSRIPLVQIEDMNAQQREQYDRFPSNLTRALLLADEKLSQALPNLANALRAASLDQKVREAVIMRVAALHANAYEKMQHIEQLAKAGWSDVEIAAIETGDFPESIASVLRFVDECVKSGDVSDVTFAAVAETFSPREIATIILIVGHYMMVARFTATLRIEIDSKADSWSQDH